MSEIKFDEQDLNELRRRLAVAAPASTLAKPAPGAATGETRWVQFNVRIRHDLKCRIDAMASEHRLGFAELLELAIDHLERSSSS